MWGIDVRAARSLTSRSVATSPVSSGLLNQMGGEMRSDATTANAIAEAVRGLPVPRPFTLQRFIDALHDCQSKPIELVAAPLGGTAPCGWLVRTGKIDYICYPTNTSWLHQLHIVLHEVGHLMLGHAVNGLPLGHSRVDTHNERAAEIFATMAARRIARVDRSIDWVGPRGMDVIALSDVFDVRSAAEDHL